MDRLKVIAHIHTDFPEKFGVPRQSGIVKSLIGRIVFEPEFRSADALKGIEEFDTCGSSGSLKASLPISSWQP